MIRLHIHQPRLDELAVGTDAAVRELDGDVLGPEPPEADRCRYIAALAHVGGAHVSLHVDDAHVFPRVAQTLLPLREPLGSCETVSFHRLRLLCSGLIQIGHVIAHHAVGGHELAEASDRSLHPLDPAPRDGTFRPLVEARDDLSLEKVVEGAGFDPVL